MVHGVIGLQSACFMYCPLCFQMDRCQQQLEQGLPPCPELEEEWRRMLRDKKRRQRDKEERERVKKHARKHTTDRKRGQRQTYRGPAVCRPPLVILICFSHTLFLRFHITKQVLLAYIKTFGVIVNRKASS